MRRSPAAFGGALILAGIVHAAAPVLEPVNDVAGDPFRQIGFVLTATDTGPGATVTFELVDPASGAVSPWTSFLTPLDVEPPRYSMRFRWFPSEHEVGRYPLRAVVRDFVGNEDSADFTITVYAPEDDITGSHDGPTVVPYNSPRNPEPYRYTVDASSERGYELEYRLWVRYFTDDSESIGAYTPWQQSPEFDVTFDHPNVFNVRAMARSAVSEDSTYLGDLLVRAYASGDLLPPLESPSLHLVGPGRVALRWQPHPENTRVTRYRIHVFSTGEAFVEEVIDVPDPANEPASYEHVLDFGDPAREDLRALVTARNARQVESNWSGGLGVSIFALSDVPDESVYFGGVPLYFQDFFPHVTSLAVEAVPVSKQVRVTLGPLELHGGLYGADEVRLYWNRYGSEPGDYQVFPAPVEGGQLILSEDGEPVVAGAAHGSLFASVVDRRLAEPDVFEGGLLEHEITLDPADCDDGVDNDRDGVVDWDGGDPGCHGIDDEDEFDRGDAFDLTRRALVVYNTNTNDAATIAEHYRAARGLPASSLCPVPLPPGGYALASELEGARRVMVEDCICRNVLGRRASECAGSAPSALLPASPITHLVLIRGIPERFFGTDWSTDEEEPPFGYYLALMLYSDGYLVDPESKSSQLYFYAGTFADEVDHQTADSIAGNVRPVQPGLDGIPAYGRVVALDTARTTELIDRTLAAEQTGVRGNLLSQGNERVFDFLRSVTDSRTDPDPAVSCTGYVDDPLQDWPHATCRAGATAEGLIPGEPEREGLVQSIPWAVDAGLYLGAGLPPGGHEAFRGFGNMLNWRREHPDDVAEPCTPLCQDHESSAQVEDCRAASGDYFREIDTRCVGVAPGLLGWQYRSWPVQYYGIQPPGWGLDTNGNREKTVPTVYRGSPYGDGYAHFGASDAVSDPTCLLGDAREPAPCPERIFVSLNLAAATGPEHASTTAFGVRLRYRRGGPAEGRLKVRIDLRNPTETFETFEWLDLSELQADWTEATLTLEVPAEALPLTGATLRLGSRRGDALSGWLDLDHVELFDAEDPMEENLLPADVASFEAPFLGPTQPGDWAANVIDRLGGIAWWGSSSHHLTGGNAFTAPDMFAGAFFGGRTLGEALLYMGPNAVSGIVYGDPLYRPSGAKIYLGDGTPEGEGYYLIVGDGPPRADPDAQRLFVDAFHGQANLARTSWDVAVCRLAEIEACDASDDWIPVESSASAGVNAVLRHPLVTEPLDLFDPALLDEEQWATLRLRVWNPREHAHELRSHALLRYQPTSNLTPEARDVRIEPQRPEVDDALFAVYTFVDAESVVESAEDRTVTWLRDGEPVAPLEGAMIVTPDVTAEGEHWRFGVSVSDGTASSETVWSAPVTIGCGAPPLPLEILAVSHDDAIGAVRFDVRDPNPAGQATGFHLYRGATPDALDLLQADAPDDDPERPDVQLVDTTGGPQLAFYRVTAFNAECSAEGP